MVCLNLLTSGVLSYEQAKKVKSTLHDLKDFAQIWCWEGLGAFFVCLRYFEVSTLVEVNNL